MQINNFSDIPDEAIDLYATEKLRAIDLDSEAIFIDVKSLQPTVYGLISSSKLNLRLQVVESVSFSISNFGKEQNTYHWILDGSPYKLAARCYVDDEFVPDSHNEILQKLPDFIKCYYQHTDGLLLTDDKETLNSGLGLPNSLGDFRNLRDFLVEHDYEEDIFYVINKKFSGVDLRAISVGTDGTFCVYDLVKSKSDIICVLINENGIDFTIIDDAEKADKYYAKQLLNWKRR